MRLIFFQKILAGLGVLIFLNFIPSLFAFFIGYDRGIFVLESLPLALLIVIESWFFVFIYGVFFVALELIYGVSQVYPLFEAAQLIDVVEFLPNANKNYILLIIVYFIVFFGFVFLALSFLVFLENFVYQSLY